MICAAASRAVAPEAFDEATAVLASDSLSSYPRVRSGCADPVTSADPFRCAASCAANLRVPRDLPERRAGEMMDLAAAETANFF